MGKILACFFLLVVVPPIPGQTPNKSTNSTANPKDSPGTQKKPTQQVPTVPIGDSGTAITDKEHGTSKPEENKPITVSPTKPLDIRADVSKDWMDRANWGFTAVLVLIGAGGVYAAVRTLNQIKRQADLMQQQLTDARVAASTTESNTKQTLALLKRQAELMHEQMLDVRSANTQTEFFNNSSLKALRSQGELMARQTTVMENQTQAVIEAHRPQIAIDPNGDALKMLIYPLMVPSATPRIVLDIFNRGVTPAYNLTYETWIEILPQPFVDFTSNVDHEPPSTPVVLTQRHPIGANIPIRKPVTTGQLESVKTLDLQACVRVRVVYDDAFSKGRCVNFGFIVMYNGLSFLPKYNGWCSDSEDKSTNQNPN